MPNEIASKVELAETAGAPSASTEAKTQRLIAVAMSNGKTTQQRNDLYLAIQALTAEDFQRLLNEPDSLKTLAKRLEDMDGTLKAPLMHSLVRRWLEVDPDSVMTWAPRALELLPSDKDIRDGLIDALAKQRPEALLAMVSSRKDAKERASFITKALTELAAQNSNKARAWLDGCTDAADRKEAEKAIRTGIVQADPLRAVELARALTERAEANQLLRAATTSAEKMGVGMLRQLVTTPMPSWMLSNVLNEFAHRDPDTVIDLVKNVEAAGIDLSTPLGMAFSALAQRDRAQAIAKLEGFSGKQLVAAVSTIGADWALSEPAAALNWLASRPAEERIDNPSSYAPSDCLTTAFGSWVKQETAAARAWADALPAGKTHDAVQRQLASSLTDLGQVEEATKILAGMGDGVDPKAVRDVALIWAQRDPHAAAEWAIAQPDGAMQTQALAAVVNSWANNNSRETQAWLGQFPAGEARDKCVSAFLLRESSWAMSAKEYFVEFDAWFDLIGDPWQRAEMAEHRYQLARQTDPAGARGWLSSVPNVDSERIRMALRKP